MNKLQTAIEALEECLYDHANGQYRGAVSKAQRERVIAMFKELMAQEPVQKVFGGIIDPTYCGVTVAPAPQAEPVAWADDNAMQGKVGNVCSTAAKRYWEKSDWVDKKNAELHKHPLYAAPVAMPAQTRTQIFTTGHCKEKAKPGGCQLHNLQCSYPECDRVLSAAPKGAV